MHVLRGARSPHVPWTEMVQDIEAGSPPNRLKRIVSSFFKKNGLDEVQVVQAGSPAPVSQQPFSNKQSTGKDQCEQSLRHVTPVSEACMPCNVAKATSDAGCLAHSTAAAGNRLAYDHVREHVLSDPGMPSPSGREQLSSLAAAEADIAAAAASLPVGQRSSNGSINEPGASVWQHEAAIGSVPHFGPSSPAPAHRSGPLVRVGRGPVCQSIDDMYSVIFGDGPQCTAGAAVPGVSQASRTDPPAAMGSGSSMEYGYQHMDSCGSPDLQVVLSATEPNSSKSCATAHDNAARRSSSVIGPLDDLIVPAGLTRIRTGSRSSGSDGSGTGFCASSPLCSRSGGAAAGMVAWQVPNVLGGALGAAGSCKGSPRYGSLSSSSGLAFGAAHQQNQHLVSSGLRQSQKRLWDRRQQAAQTSGASVSCASSGVSTPCPDIATAAGSSSAPGGVWRIQTSLSTAGPGNFADIAAKLGGRCSPSDDPNTPYTHSSCSATPLSHSYSNPEAAGAGAGAMPPACARALFGSVPQMDRPLMSVGSGSWLTRADSGLMDDHLSVASDDEYIREVNAENVLSSVWGPANGTSKLLSFKYSVATSPLNHPGRASPFRASPFNSPRGQRDNSLADLLSLRSATSAVHSCPGSPLAHQPSNSTVLSDAALSAAAAQHRHRHPFGRCTVDSISSYRPSPLQQHKQRANSDACEQQGMEQPQLQQQGCATDHVSSQNSECLAQPLQNSCLHHYLEDGTVEGQHSDFAQTTVSQQGFYAGPAGVYSNERGPDHESAEQKVIIGTGPHTTSAQHSSRPSSSTRSAGRAAGSAAATVGALMAGWDSSAAAGSSAGEDNEFSRYDDQYECSSSNSMCTAVQVLPLQLLSACSGSSSLETMAAALAGTADSTRADSSSCNHHVCSSPAATGETPCSEYSSSSSISACRSKSMPTPALMRSSSSGSGSILGIGVGNLLGGGVSPVAQGLPTSYSTPPPHPHLQTAASADFQQQVAKPGDLPRQSSIKRKGSRLSSSSISNPSRLSQSSAAGELPEQHMSSAGARRTLSTNSNSSNGGLLLSISGSGSPTPGSRQLLSSRSVFERQQPTAASPAAMEAPQGSVQQQLREAMELAISQLQQPEGSQAETDTTALVTIDVDGLLPNTTLAADPAYGLAAAAGWAFNSDSPTTRRPSPAAVHTAANADSQAVVLMPSLPEVDFIERIGRGSFGDVYKGVWCGSVVAVKVIRVKQQLLPGISAALSSPGPAGSANSSAYTGRMSTSSSGTSSTSPGEQQQVAVELAQHEYESWLNANLRHPNIVQLFTSFTVVLEDRPAGLLSGGGSVGMGLLGTGVSWKTHLVMEYCELGTMQGALQRGLFKDPQCPACGHPLWVLITAKEFCVAISYLHSMDVVHGDLKSSNVLLKAAATAPLDGRGFVAKVSDFGLSRVMDAISAATTAASACAGDAAASENGSGAPLGQWPVQPHFGALSHAAPELIRGEELSKASDVYSVGVLLWELVTGQAPFIGTHPGQLLNMKLCHPTSELLPFPESAPAALVSLALDCWADSPAQRPTMPAVVDRLNSFASELLGEEQAVMLFPDIACKLSAQRRSAAAAGVSGCSSRLSYGVDTHQGSPAMR